MKEYEYLKRNWSSLDRSKKHVVLMGVETKGYIPDDLNFIISSDGQDIYQLNPFKRLNQFDRDGYRVVWVQHRGKSRAFAVHRLVALGFLPLGYHDPKDFIINHKDSNRSNNTVNNLEWVYYTHNNAHAISTKERKNVRGGRYLVYDFTNKVERTCPSIRFLASFIGVRYEHINKYLFCPVKTKYGYFIYTLEETGWEDYNFEEFDKDTVIDLTNKNDPNSRGVRVINLVTGLTYYYHNLTEVSEKLEIPLTNLYQIVDDPTLNGDMYKNYRIELVSDQLEVRKWLKDDGHYDYSKFNANRNLNKRKKIRILNVDTKEEFEFEWFGEFVAYLNKHYPREDGKDYVLKNVQRTFTANYLKSGKRTWKQFELEYV